MGLQYLKLGSQSPQQKSSKSLLTTADTGFENTVEYKDKPVVSTFVGHKSKNKDSILDSVNTGFGNQNTLIKDCPKPQYKTPLYEENYLSEFNSETEKAIARQNLGVVGEDEIIKLVSEIINNDTETFITKLELEQILENFVISDLKAHVNYEIPDKLFQL